jgi:hypothetical protein
MPQDTRPRRNGGVLRKDEGPHRRKRPFREPESDGDGDDTAPIPKRRKKAISAARPPLAPIDNNTCHTDARLIFDNMRKRKAEMASSTTTAILIEHRVPSRLIVV